MKRKGFIFGIISLFIFILCSCGTKEPSLYAIIATLDLAEANSVISYDFNVPKELDYKDSSFEITWTSEARAITIKEQETTVLVDVDFDSLSSGLHYVVLTATIHRGVEEASKPFTITLSKDGDLGGKPNGGTIIDPDLGTTTDNFTFSKKEYDSRLGVDGPLTEEAFPSIGNPKMLVIPVNLKDSEKTPKNLKEIKTAFTGTSDATGWESVQSYYAKSSYGKLNMEITVLSEWFTPKYTASYYESYSDEESDGSTLILREALAHFDDKIDYSEYDYNNDGYIDGVWLIYNYDVNFDSDDSIFWAYTYWNYEETKYDGVEAYYYAWAGIDFMHPTTEEAGFYDPSDITVDAHTYIHETGHMMGLDDYYDYDESAGANSKGFYGCDMMDFNIGDHSAISKLLLGWVNPIIAEGKGTGTIDLKSFTTSGEFIIVADHKLNSIYDTYWTIEFYTNDGLNAHDKPFDSNTVSYGIRIMEIHAEKNLVNGQVEYNSGTYQTGFKYDNSDESIMFADGIYEKTPEAFNSFSVNADCLYQVNEAMKQNGIPFELVVNSMTGESANITITIK